MLQLNNHNIILPKYLSFVKESPCEFFRKKESRRNPARIPPQTPPAGGKSAEAGRILSPRQIVSPCRVHFNRLDFARKTFELCPTNTANLHSAKLKFFERARARRSRNTKKENKVVKIGIIPNFGIDLLILMNTQKSIR